MIADTELKDRFNYKSSDAGASAQRPKLVVQYTVNGPTPTPTLTPTPTTPPAPVFSHAAFVYDGDGKRVKSAITTNVGTTTMYFVGSYYEASGSTITKYYYAGSQRIAMRVGSTLYYLLTDHLGSTSLTTDAGGNVVSEMRYSAWGEVRYSSGSSPTKYQYTGQFSHAAEFGLLFYNARWYDGRLARFTSADTILPGIENPQAWDRYASVNNNPIRYSDPSGHRPDDGCRTGEGCSANAGTIEDDIRRDNDFRQTTERNQCRAGDRRHCGASTASILAFAGSMLVGGILAETFILGGGLAGVADAALWRAGLSCIQSIVCRLVTGAAGGAESVWSKNPLERGQIIEKQLGRSPQLSDNFPVIDRFENGTATSIKSIDLTANTYQNTSNLANKVQSYGSTLAEWQGTGKSGWGGVLITNAAIAQRELLLAIPPNATQAQSAVLQQLQTWGQSIGIQINIVVVP